MDRLFCVFGVEEQQTRRDFTRNGSFDISSTFWISLSNYNTIKNAVINFKWVIKVFLFQNIRLLCDWTAQIYFATGEERFTRSVNYSFE